MSFRVARADLQDAVKLLGAIDAKEDVRLTLVVNKSVVPKGFLLPQEGHPSATFLKEPGTWLCLDYAPLGMVSNIAVVACMASVSGIDANTHWAWAVTHGKLDAALSHLTDTDITIIPSTADGSRPSAPSDADALLCTAGKKQYKLRCNELNSGPEDVYGDRIDQMVDISERFHHEQHMGVSYMMPCTAATFPSKLPEDENVLSIGIVSLTHQGSEQRHAVIMTEARTETIALSSAPDNPSKRARTADNEGSSVLDTVMDAADEAEAATTVIDFNGNDVTRVMNVSASVPVTGVPGARAKRLVRVDLDAKILQHLRSRAGTSGTLCVQPAPTTNGISAFLLLFGSLNNRVHSFAMFLPVVPD
jgi:hypothetical protein